MTNTGDVAPLRFHSLDEFRTFCQETLSDQNIPNVEATLNLYQDAKKDEEAGHQEWAYLTYKRCMDAFSQVVDSEDGPWAYILDKYQESAKMSCEQLLTTLEIRYAMRDRYRELDNTTDGFEPLANIYSFVRMMRQEYTQALDRKIQIGTKIINSVSLRDHMMSNEVNDIFPRCSICFEVPTTKIFQCHEGHILCETCSANPNVREKCPVCRTAYWNERKCRNRELEKLLHILSSSNGIPTIGKVDDDKSINMRNLLDEWKDATKSLEAAYLKYNALKLTRNEDIPDVFLRNLDFMLSSRKISTDEIEEIKIKNIVNNIIKCHF